MLFDEYKVFFFLYALRRSQVTKNRTCCFFHEVSCGPNKLISSFFSKKAKDYEYVLETFKGKGQNQKR